MQWELGTLWNRIKNWIDLSYTKTRETDSGLYYMDKSIHLGYEWTSSSYFARCMDVKFCLLVRFPNNQK